MVSIIDFGVFRNVRKLARLWLIAACFGLLVPLSSVWGAFPCEDVNNDGVCDPGEKDITAELLDDSYYSTSESIVIPADMKKNLSTKNLDGFVLMAGKNITVNASLTASAKGAPIIFQAQDGTINIGNKSTLRAGEGGFVDIGAQHDVIIGPGVSVYAKQGTLYVLSWEGDVLLMKGSRLYGEYGVDVTTVGQGEVTVYAGSELNSQRGHLGINSGGNTSINGSRLYAEDTSIRTGANLIDFRNNYIAGPPYTDVWVLLSAAGSTVDIRGSRFRNLHTNGLIINAENVMK